jgi:hypothetical protein
MILARNQSFFNQAIDSHADGSGSEPDFRSNRIHRERTFMQDEAAKAESKSGLPMFGNRFTA